MFPNFSRLKECEAFLDNNDYFSYFLVFFFQVLEKWCVACSVRPIRKSILCVFFVLTTSRISNLLWDTALDFPTGHQRSLQGTARFSVGPSHQDASLLGRQIAIPSPYPAAVLTPKMITRELCNFLSVDFRGKRGYISGTQKHTDLLGDTKNFS